METVNIKINGRAYSVPKDSTVLEAARYAGVEIPTLCYYSCINYFTVQRHYLWFLSVNILPVQQNLRISLMGEVRPW